MQRNKHNETRYFKQYAKTFFCGNNMLAGIVMDTLPLQMRRRVWGYMKGEYMYMLSNGTLTLKYKTYAIKLLDNALEA